MERRVRWVKLDGKKMMASTFVAEEATSDREMGTNVHRANTRVVCRFNLPE